MAKRDVLDKEKARRFAWRITEPEASAALDEAPRPSPAAQAPRDPKAEQELAKYAAERCEELAEQILRVWAMTSRPEQAAATQKLLRGATRLGFRIVRMADHPLEAVRLWRLVLRHRKPSRERTFDLFALGFMPVSSHQREVIDLLVDAAETGDHDVAFAMDRSAATEETGRRHPELGARLARIVDEGKTWAARALAARWLALADFPDAIPALRRALRQPHMRLRYCALFILPQMKGPALLEEDVLWLLEDAVKHPLPRGWGAEAFGRVLDYEDALIEAVRKAPPAEGVRPLEIIAGGGGEHIHREREGLDAGWALRALAAGYPGRAVARIDRALLSTSSSCQRDALEAIGLLPDELARPRLLAAAAREEHHLVERAKEVWFDRFGGVCPVEPLAGVPVELLSEPPSERLFACLLVLRGASDEARHAMMDALLAEAPERDAPPESLSAAQREALALVLFALRHTGRIGTHPTLPSSEAAWTELLLRRFGAPAFAPLATIAERAAVAGVPFGWLNGLADAARAGRLTEPERDHLRDIARAALASPAWDYATAPLIALSSVGAPLDLEDRLWSILTALNDDDTPDKRRADAAYWAASSLATMRDAPGLDARVAAAAGEARRAGKWALFDQLVGLGAERGAAAVLDVAERAVADYDGDPAAFGPVMRGAWALERAGRIDGTWILEQLRRPSSSRFAIAAHLVRKPVSEPVLEALRGALEAIARDGAAAAEAASELLVVDAMAVDDARLDGILERAPAHAGAKLVSTLLYCEAPLAGYRRHVVDLLLSADAEAANEVIESLYMRQPEGTWELCEELLPRVPAGEVRRVMQHYLRAPSEAALYWVDANDEEEEEEEEEEGEEKDGEDELDGGV